MDTLLTLQVLILLLGTAIAILLALHAWMRRPATGSVLFALLMLSVSVWSLTYVLELSYTPMAQKLLWNRIKYIGIVSVPVVWLLFVWDYTGRQEWLHRRNILAIALVPALTLLLAFTNDNYQLLWQQIPAKTTPPVTYLYIQYGPWFWVHTAFAYLYLLAGSALLLVHWLQQNSPLYRWQTASLLIGLLLPWIGNLLYVLRLSLVDLTPFAFALTGLLLIRHALRFRLFDISPVAHRTVVNSMQEGVLVLDRQRRVVEANPAMVKILSSPDGLIGEPVANIWADLARQLNDQDELHFEIPLAHPADPDVAEAAYYEVTVSHLSGWQQISQGWLLLIRDITLRKQAERIRNDMTRSLVHDLRAPISNSLFALEMLQNELAHVVSSDDKMLLEMTMSNTQKTLRLVNEILSIHRLESGNVPVSFSPISLPALIDRVVSEQQSHVGKRGLTVIQQLPHDLPLAWADRGLLERVLQNLLDNSIKFSPAAGSITISATHNGNNQILVSVGDEGPGVAPELQPAIFEKYVTGESSESGSGLGLSFCHMAIQAHEQDIWVENRTGSGARFTFSLAVNAENEEIR